MAKATKQKSRKPATKAKSKSAIAPSSKSVGVSGLLQLPPELRNRIYDLVIPTDQTFDLRSPDRLPTRPPSISQVCQQLRQECLPVWRSQNLWIIWSDEGFWLRRWLAAEKLSGIEDSNLKVILERKCKSCEQKATTSRGGMAAAYRSTTTCDFSLTLSLEKRVYCIEIDWEDECKEREIEGIMAYEEAKGWMKVIEKVTGKALKEDVRGLQVRGAGVDD